MDKIRDWLRPRSSSATTAEADASSSSASRTREDRADHVADMRADVSRLQQEILALSTADEGASAKQSKMSRLERELDTAQRELAKLQGRI